MSQREVKPQAGERSRDRRDRTVIGQYLEGDSGAVESVERWIRTEIRSSFPLLGDESDDLTQVVHGKLVEALSGGRFRHHAALKTYVSRVTRYTCVDRIRAWKRARLSFVEDPATLSSAEGLRDIPYRRLFGAERDTLLLQIMMLAPEMCRNLWHLAYVERLSYQEIGQRLSLPPGTIKSRMWACRRRAMALLDRQWSGE